MSEEMLGQGRGRDQRNRTGRRIFQASWKNTLKEEKSESGTDVGRITKGRNSEERGREGGRTITRDDKGRRW